MKYEPRKPVRLGERRETEREVVAEAATCPECGSTDYHHIDGCMLCQSCGYSPCGVH
jgi:ribosomal protein L37AE/L43A